MSPSGLQASELRQPFGFQLPADIGHLSEFGHTGFGLTSKLCGQITLQGQKLGGLRGVGRQLLGPCAQLVFQRLPLHSCTREPRGRQKRQLAYWRHGAKLSVDVRQPFTDQSLGTWHFRSACLPARRFPVQPHEFLLESRQLGFFFLEQLFQVGERCRFRNMNTGLRRQLIELCLCRP